MKLVINQVATDEPKQIVETPTHRIMVVDCSGSMGSELPKLRTHLKNKLPTMILPQDTLTIVWFSGRGQCGTLFESIKLDSLQDIQKINAAIDRYLTPVGLTAFTQPLKDVLALATKTGGTTTISFMTDGYDNQGTRSEILKACADLQDVLAAATFVEYGYYADHKMLMDMAEEVGGAVVLAENFTNYSESLETSFKSVNSGKKIKIGGIKADFVVANNDNGFVIVRPDALGLATMPADTTTYAYLEGTGDISEIDTNDVRVRHSTFMVSALIMRGQADLALQLAAVIGDVELYAQVENSFSKQDYAVTVELANAFGAGKKSLYSTKPRQSNLIPDENAYNVLTMLMDLASVDGNFLNISHPDFEYNPIGARRDVAETVDGETTFKPVFKDKAGEVLAEITTLKFDEDRPNISTLVRREGTVNLPKNDFGFGETIDTFIWRNYAIVRDGIVNVRKLPVVLSKATYDVMVSKGVIDASDPFKVGKTFVIDTKRYPIINRAMATPTTSTELFQKCFDVYVLKSKQKVLNAKIDKPEFGAKFASLYGDVAAKFLKELGIGEGGFSPKTVKGEAVDSYIAKVLEVKLSGLSSIPKIEDVYKAVAAKKSLTPSQSIMAAAIKEVDKVKDYEAELKKVKDQIHQLMDEIVIIKFGIIIGKRWFVDMESLDDNTREIDFGLDKLVKCQAVMSDKEV